MATPDDLDLSVPSKPNDDLLREMLRRFDEAYSADQIERDAALDDLRFYNGEQWDATLKANREKAGKPCLTLNTLPTYANQVINAFRQNPIAIKIRPHDGESDSKLAELRNGIIRDIETTSNCHTVVYPMALQYVVACGRGWMRINTPYVDDKSFEQELRVELIPDPVQVAVDPIVFSQLPNNFDPNYLFVPVTITREEFKSRYPEAAITEFDQFKNSVCGEYTGWYTDKNVRLVEYWRKVPVAKETLYLLKDGSVATEKPAYKCPSRPVTRYAVEQYICSGAEVLDGPVPWPDTLLPFIPAWGEELNIEGTRTTRGMTRNAKDAFRMYNYNVTSFTEVNALQPRAPYMVTPKMIAGYEGLWNDLNSFTKTHILYHPDPEAPGNAPHRETPPQPSPAHLAGIELAGQAKQETTGLFAANLGEPSNEKSGKAIFARQQQGETSTFAYPHNLAVSLVWLGDRLNRLIPIIYSGARQVRVRGLDNSEDYRWVNRRLGPNENPRDYGDGTVTTDRDGYTVLNDLDVGRFDTVTTTGPAYATQRLEILEYLTQLVQAVPDSFALLADVLMKHVDIPNAEEIAKRFRVMLPPQVQALLPHDEDEDIPPMPEPAPDPMMEIELQKGQIELEKAEIEKEKAIVDLQGKYADIENKARAAKMPPKPQGGEK
jgi:hypothetical protein